MICNRIDKSSYSGQNASVRTVTYSSYAVSIKQALRDDERCTDGRRTPPSNFLIIR